MKKKLQLHQLQVKSFVTLENKDQNDLRGGTGAMCKTDKNIQCYNETKWPVCQVAVIQ